jgi:APA family basic amino acid/polyamine antiporter
MFALISTLNAQFASSTKPMLQASIDGWLPKQLGFIHPRFKTPMVWLTVFYVIGLLPVLTGLNIGEVANMVLIITNLMIMLTNLLIIRIPKVIPEVWEKSKFKISNTMLYLIAIVSVIFGLISIVLMISFSTPFLMACNGGMLVLSVVYCILRVRSGKVHMEVSYESI